MGKQREQNDTLQSISSAQDPQSSLETSPPERIEALSFESALNALEELAEKMEEGELNLEDALHCYEQGVALHRHCQQTLDNAEQKVRILTEKGKCADNPTLALDESS